MVLFWLAFLTHLSIMNNCKKKRYGKKFISIYTLSLRNEQTQSYRPRRKAITSLFSWSVQFSSIFFVNNWAKFNWLGYRHRRYHHDYQDKITLRNCYLGNIAEKKYSPVRVSIWVVVAGVWAVVAETFVGWKQSSSPLLKGNFSHAKTSGQGIPNSSKTLAQPVFTRLQSSRQGFCGPMQGGE